MNFYCKSSAVHCHKLTPSKTIICPRSITILGWIWTQGRISASPHRLATLASCCSPDKVRGLRSFIGAFKILGRVLPHCRHMVVPLDSAIAGQQSQDTIHWNDTLREQSGPPRKPYQHIKLSHYHVHPTSSGSSHIAPSLNARSARPYMSLATTSSFCLDILVHS